MTDPETGDAPNPHAAPCRETPFSVRTESPLGKLTKHIPPGQFARYLLVGAANTAFGYGSFALFTALLMPYLPHGYVLASLLSSVLNITVSFLNYKRFVFKTKGNYVREWFRCVIVYSGGIVISMAMLPVLVLAIHRWTGLRASAPYFAGAVVMACMTIYSFLGHRKFSFRRD